MNTFHLDKGIYILTGYARKLHSDLSQAKIPCTIFTDIMNCNYEIIRLDKEYEQELTTFILQRDMLGYGEYMKPKIVIV